jgi:hypothetical protein
MDPRKAKEDAGKILMLLSFLHIISLLPFIPSPIVSLIEISHSLSTLETSGLGLLGFMIFLLGFELWERNRLEHQDL